MDMFESLLTSSSSPRVSAELLEMLGRKASQMYQQQGVPLNDAIRQLAAEHPDLGNEHIKRIVEFANTVTFQEMFQKGSDKNVHFPVADPGVVIRDLKDGGSPAHDGKTLNGGMGDYAAPPQAGGKGLDNELGGLFGASASPGVEKNASVEPLHRDHAVHANPFDDVYDTHVRLQATREKIAEAHERFDLLMKQAQEDFYRAVKHEVLSPEGAGLGGVIGLLEKIASQDTAAHVLASLTDRLLEEGVSGSSMMMSLEKRAGKVVNWAHPVVQTWGGLVKAAEEKAKSALALKEVDEAIEKTSGALATGIKKAVGVRGKVPSGLRQRFSRSK